MVPDALSGGPHFAAYCERYIRHTKGRWAGRPLIYEPWQREFWWEALEFDPATGLRIYNEVGLGIPRKNTKSTMASAAGLYMLDADGEPEPEVYVAAAARNQAGIVLGQARSMVSRSPLLLDRLVPHRYTIECPRNGGIMRSLSSDAALQHGLNPSANIVDELHAHKSAELYTALTTGTGAREQPFTLWITTAGVAGEGILAELFESMFTGSGELEDRGSLLIYRDRVNGTLIYWYGAPRDADIEDPAVWYAANPVSWLHDGKYLGAQFARLRARGALLEWRRYHLNQFVGFEDAWLRDGAWRATTGDLPLNPALPIGVGIDRSPGGEHAAIAVAQRQGDRVVVRAQVFAPESATGMASTEAMRVRLRALRTEYPLAQARDERTKRALPGPAFAYDRQAFGESAEMLTHDGLNARAAPAAPAAGHRELPVTTVEVGSPEWWLDRLGRRLTERAGRATFNRVGRRDDASGDRRLVDATGMALYQAYYEGKHRETYKIRRVIEAFGLRMPIYVNYAGVVVDSISERLGVDGFTFGGDDRASAAAWEIWQDNNLDAGFKRGMRSGLIKGEFSLVLWPDEEWSPRIWVEDGAEVIVSVHPETGVRRAALKRWADEDEPGAMFATLFLPTAVYKYRTPAAANTAGAELATVGGTAWERRIVPGEPWPLPNPLGEVPVIPFPNKPDLHLVGESELGKVVPIQDAINANIANVMLAGLYGAFRQKVMLNFALEVDPATGAPVQPFDVALDSLITVPPNAPGEPEPRLAEFSQTDLAGYIKVHETLVQAIATASRFPPHYLLGTQGTFPSGESLTAVERGISAVAGERGDDWKDPLEDAMRLAFRIKARAPGNSAAAAARFEKWAAMTGAEAAFRNPETKSESQHVDAVTKKKDLDVPRRQLWTELGYSQQQVLDWEAELAAAPPEPAQPVIPIPEPIDTAGGAQAPS